MLAPSTDIINIYDIISKLSIIQKNAKALCQENMVASIDDSFDARRAKIFFSQICDKTTDIVQFNNSPEVQALLRKSNYGKMVAKYLDASYSLGQCELYHAFTLQKTSVEADMKKGRSVIFMNLCMAFAGCLGIISGALGAWLFPLGVIDALIMIAAGGVLANSLLSIFSWYSASNVRISSLTTTMQEINPSHNEENSLSLKSKILNTVQNIKDDIEKMQIAFGFNSNNLPILEKPVDPNDLDTLALSATRIPTAIEQDRSSVAYTFNALNLEGLKARNAISTNSTYSDNEHGATGNRAPTRRLII